MKENRRKCLKCGSSPADNPNITLHRFPKPGKTNSLRCELWAKYCFPHDSWSSTKFQTQLYTEHRMLCTKHFNSSSFIDGSGKRLFRFAIPDQECDKLLNLNAPNEPIAGPSKMTQPLTENMNLLNSPTPNKAKADSSTMTQPSAENVVFEKCLSEKEPVEGPSTLARHQPLIAESLNSQTAFAAKLQQVATTFVPVAESKKLRTNREKQLYVKCKKHLKKIWQLKKRVKHLKNETFLNAITKNESVIKLMNSKISSSFALLLQGQLQNFKKKSKGRRWNEESKIIALRLYKKSPTCYKLIRRLICLPAPSTLKSLLNRFHLGVGINKHIFNVLKKITKEQESSDKEHVLMFDEMSIKKNLYYNRKEDSIDGFQDHGTQGRSLQVASCALVFMVAGIRKKVKQPVAYYFSGGSVTADRLAVLLKEVLQHCFDAGLNIAATVCDLDGVNKRALGILGATLEQPHITIRNQEVVTLFDTPHLLKCFRNLFMKYDIKCLTNITSDNTRGIGIAKWGHIKQFYELDNSNPNFVFAPCLKQDHLNPNTKQKMKVKLAAQVLSHSVAAGMYAKISQGELSTEAATTANVISNMDKLFDSVNASTPDLRRGKPHSTNFKKNSPHLQLFQEMKLFFKNLEFLGCRRTPPSQQGWIWTLNGLERLWSNLTTKHKSIKSLATRRIQQDPLENLFGCIRGNCGSNTNPTAGQFVAGLKTAVLGNLSQTGLGNCEKDENDVILDNYKTILTSVTDISTDHDARIFELELLHDFERYEDSMDKPTGEIQACAYVCGFILKNNPIKCNDCKKAFVAETQEREHIFIEFKEYNNLKNSLMYASKAFVLCIENSTTLINTFLEKEAYQAHLRETVIQLLKNSINFDFLNHCAEHKEANVNYLIKSSFYIAIKRFCTLKNRLYSEEASASALRRKIEILKNK